MEKPRLRLVTESDRAEAVEAIDVDPDARAAVARLAGVAAASAASVLAQMVRAPVLASELDVRILSAAHAVTLPLLQPRASVRAHRTIRGDLSGDLVMGQSEEMASWLGSSLSLPSGSDTDWTNQKLSDLAGISLAAFGLSLGRSVDMRLEPELSKEDAAIGPDGVLVRAVTERRLVLAMESRVRDHHGIGDFFFFAAEDEITKLLSAGDMGL